MIKMVVTVIIYGHASKWTHDPFVDVKVIISYAPDGVGSLSR